MSVCSGQVGVCGEFLTPGSKKRLESRVAPQVPPLWTFTAPSATRVRRCEAEPAAQPIANKLHADIVTTATSPEDTRKLIRGSK